MSYKSNYALNNFFAEYISKHGQKEIIEHLDTLGGSPLLNGDSWDPSKYDVAKVIEQESYYGLLSFFGYEIKNYNETFTFTYKGLFIRNFFSLNISVYYSDYSDPDTIIYSQYKFMLNEMFQTYRLGTNERDLLDSKFDRSVERVKVFDNVRIEFYLPCSNVN